jgi:uncharacterized protein YjiS (DUF1127 family)
MGDFTHMTASLSHHQLSPSFPANASARGDAVRPAGSRGGTLLGGLAAPIAHVVRALRNFGARERVINELSRLSDYELRDIGLSRPHIARVFDPKFAAEYAQRR